MQLLIICLFVKNSIGQSLNTQGLNACKNIYMIYFHNIYIFRYNSASIVLTIVGTCLGIYILNKILRIDDLMLSILSQISSISEAILKSIAYEGWHLYLGTLIIFTSLII